MVLKGSHTLLNRTQEAGFGLLQLLVASALGSIIVSIAVAHFFEASYLSHDHQVKSLTEQNAQAILDLFSHELRMIGNGIPFAQSNFKMSSGSLGNAPLPVLLTADQDFLEFRVNLDGSFGILSSTFTPSASNLQFSLNSTAPFPVGRELYLSNFLTGGHEGLRGVVESVHGQTVTLDSQFTSSSGASFPEGSMATPIELVQYESVDDWSGIRRSDSMGSVLLVSNSRFALRYLDRAGAIISPPLDQAKIANLLSTIEISVFVRGHLPLKDGSVYTTQRIQSIGLRNINFAR